MMRAPSFLSRLSRVVTALATVWSLGCCGFEPMLSALFAADGAATMACADGDSGSNAIADSGDASHVTVGADQSRSTDAACSCTNCLAPSPTVAVTPVAAPGPARALAIVVWSLPSIVRAPLVPPPQFA